MKIKILKSDFTVIEDKKEIEQAQLTFAKNMKKEATKHGDLFAAHQHGKKEVHAYFFKDNNFWWGYHKAPKSKIPNWWNVFRFIHNKTGEPYWNHQNGMTCQINPPISGNTWQQAGVFVKDSDNEIYIAHTGKIGGGREGIGRGLFVDNYPGTQQWQEVTSSRGKKNVVIISSINSSNLISNIGLFVKAVDDIKAAKPLRQILKKSKLSKPKKSKKYHREFSGPRKSYSLKGLVEANVYHGKVVDCIGEICKDLGYSISSYPTDLYVEGKSKKSVLMEVKTERDTYSRYTAIGQLFYYSSDLPKNTKLVVVFPKPKIPEFKKVLTKLGIEYVTYTKGNKQPKFDSSLDRILKAL
jgi:hypothetical protein